MATRSSSRADSPERLVERAIDAYLRTYPEAGSLPSSSDSAVVFDGFTRFVVLRNGKRVVAVYRVSPTGALMFQPPESITEAIFGTDQ
jgi:hypothetical protein